MKAMFVRLIRRFIPQITEVYVICESGVPVIACVDEASVRRETRQRPRKAGSSVHRIAVVDEDAS